MGVLATTNYASEALLAYPIPACGLTTELSAIRVSNRSAQRHSEKGNIISRWPGSHSLLGSCAMNMNKGISYAIILSVVSILLLVPFCRTLPVGTVKAGGTDQTKPASPAKPFKVAIYDADPEHLWNRLYAAIYVRSTDEGHSHGQDELDPLLWENSTYLLTEPRYQQVLGLLNEFLDRRGEKLIAHPLKRALLQHDLWAVFDWLADPTVEHVSTTAHLGAERRALRNRLAPVIRRLALSVKQIETLPDNYSV